MKQLDHRLRWLERVTGQVIAPCRLCATRMNQAGFGVVWEGESDLPEYCPECGRHQVLVLRFESPEGVDPCD